MTRRDHLEGQLCAACLRLAVGLFTDRGAGLEAVPVCDAHWAHFSRVRDARILEERAQALRTFTDEEAGRHVAS